MNVKNEEKQKAQNLLRQGMRPKEVSSLLGVHISTIYNWKKELNPLPKSTLEQPAPKNEKILFDKIERKGELEKENQKLKKENEILKSKIKELEEVVADLVIKLKQSNENWLK